MFPTEQRSSNRSEVAPDKAFRIVESRPIAEAGSGFLRMEELGVDTPSGRMTRVVVRHPGAVAVIPLLEESILMIRQYRVPVDAALLELPAGIRDEPNEAPEATARRELEEEIGYRAGTVRPLMEFFSAPGFTDEHMTLYLATELAPVPRSPRGAEEEAAEVVTVPLTAIADLLASGDVSDAKTIIGLQWLLTQME